MQVMLYIIRSVENVSFLFQAQFCFLSALRKKMSSNINSELVKIGHNVQPRAMVTRAL